MLLCYRSDGANGAFASGRVSSVDMLRAGIVLNMWGAFIIAGYAIFSQLIL